VREASTDAVSRDYLLSNKYRKAEVDRRLEELRQQAALNRKITPDEVDMTNMRAFYILAPEYLYAARDEIVKR
jgi:protein tyrosine/serine phosphatase